MIYINNKIKSKEYQANSINLEFDQKNIDYQIENYNIDLKKTKIEDCQNSTNMNITKNQDEIFKNKNKLKNFNQKLDQLTTVYQNMSNKYA